MAGVVIVIPGTCGAIFLKKMDGFGKVVKEVMARSLYIEKMI